MTAWLDRHPRTGTAVAFVLCFAPVWVPVLLGGDVP